MTKKNWIKQKGSALLMTVLILAGIMTVALNTANVVMTGTVLSGVQERSTLSLYAAEAGAERFLFDARVNRNLPNSNVLNMYGTTTLSNGAYYVVDYATSSPNISATSSGFFLETKRVVGISF